MQRPLADPTKLLDAWMEWERGEATPGRVMATLKTGGLREILEGLAAEHSVAAPSPAAGPTGSPGEAGSDGWTPIV